MRPGLALSVAVVVVAGLWLVARSVAPARLGGQPPAAADGKLDQVLERLDRIERRLDAIEELLTAAQPPFGEQWIPRERLRTFSEQPTGEPVVESNGGWWTVVPVQTKDGKTLVHFKGWDDSWNEWVGGDRLRYLALPASLQPSMQVLVKWSGVWLPAVTVEVDGDRAQLAARKPNSAAPAK